MKLTSATTAREGFDGVTERTGIFAEDSGSRCGTGGTSESSRMCGEHVHDVLGRVSSVVVVDFISLFAVVPPEEFGREERTTGESEPFIVNIYIYSSEQNRRGGGGGEW